MTLNVVGMIGVTPSNGKIPVSIIGGGIDVDYLGRFTQAHEESNFDAVLVGYSSDSADSFAVAQAAAAAMRSASRGPSLRRRADRSTRPLRRAGAGAVL